LQREEREKPWCLTDNALPCDTPQLAAGRLHLNGLRPFQLHVTFLNIIFIMFYIRI